MAMMLPSGFRSNTLIMLFQSGTGHLIWKTQPRWNNGQNTQGGSGTATASYQTVSSASPASDRTLDVVAREWGGIVTG